VITLPSGTFKPYAGVATAILIFEKKPSTKSVWFYELSADGFSMSDTRSPIEDNDIPDLLIRWQERQEGPRSFNVPVGEIIKNGYELMPGHYKAQKIHIVTHDSPVQVIDNVMKIEDEIQTRLKALREKVRS